MEPPLRNGDNLRFYYWTEARPQLVRATIEMIEAELADLPQSDWDMRRQSERSIRFGAISILKSMVPN